ncbi:transmembrane protein [Cystoisospora suis]|uniref:Transmembrane protein n=1 Tax=Cystoisospora suis TaxID=483139 RepID=A0A2C6L4Y6_9APIC|nr:transmembrane protein [Cystoisospora suis]
MEVQSHVPSSRGGQSYIRSPSAPRTYHSATSQRTQVAAHPFRGVYQARQTTRHRPPASIPVARSSAEAAAACSSHCPRILVAAAQQLLLITHAIALLLIGREVYVQTTDSSSVLGLSSHLTKLPSIVLTAPFSGTSEAGAVLVSGNKLATKPGESYGTGEQGHSTSSASPADFYLPQLSLCSGLVFLGGCLSCLILLFAPVTSLPYMRLCMIHRNNRVLAAQEGVYTPSLLTEIVPEIVMAILGAFVLFGFVLSEQQICKHIAECISVIFLSSSLKGASPSSGFFSVFSHSPVPEVSSVAPFVSLLAAAAMCGCAYGLLLPYFSSTLIAIVSFFSLAFAISVPFFPFPSSASAFSTPPPSLIYFLPPSFLPCFTLGALLVVFCCIKHYRKYCGIMCPEERWLSSVRIGITVCIFSCAVTATLSFFSSLDPGTAGPTTWAPFGSPEALSRMQPFLPRVSTCCGAICALLLVLSIIHTLMVYFSIQYSAVGLRLQGAFFSLFNLPSIVPTDADGNPELSAVPGLSQCMPSPDEEAGPGTPYQSSAPAVPLLLLPGSPLPQHMRPGQQLYSMPSQPKPTSTTSGVAQQLLPGYMRGEGASGTSSYYYAGDTRGVDDDRRGVMMVRTDVGTSHTVGGSRYHV